MEGSRTPESGGPTYAQLEALLALAPEAVFVADEEGRYTFVNLAACRLLGCSAAAIVGRNILDFIPPEDGPRLRAARQNLMRGATDFGEWRLRRKDGTWAEVEVSAKFVPGGMWVGFARDIAERKAQAREHERLEEAVRANERLMQTVFDLLPLGVWIADESGRVVRQNPASVRIWAGSRRLQPGDGGEYLGWWVETGEPIAPDEWALARAVRRGESSRGELIRIRCFDGSFRTIIDWAAPILGPDGAVVGAVGVNEDVTSLQRTQEQLRQAVRARERILAVVAHDLRSPLHRIMIGTSSIEARAADFPGGEKTRDLARSLGAITEQTARLADDLLAVAVAGDGGTPPLQLAPVPAASLLAQAAEAAEPLLAQASLELIVETLGWLPVLHVDADRILRVFANLVDNAVKFTSAPGYVRMVAERIAGGARFCLENSGPALGAEGTASMFRPFWQRSRDARGTGLGLSICRSMVEAHGGSIWAESAEGARVRVCFVLPRLSLAAMGEKSPPAPGKAPPG